MTILLIVLTVAGAGLATWGAVDMYQGRMREAPEDDMLLTIPKDSPKGLVLTLVGVAVGLVAGVLGSLS